MLIKFHKCQTLVIVLVKGKITVTVLNEYFAGFPGFRYRRKLYEIIFMFDYLTERY